MHDAVVPDPRPVVHVRVLPRPADAPWPVARLWSRMALSAPGTARRAQSEISRVSLASWCMYMSRRAVVSLEPGAGRGCLSECVTLGFKRWCDVSTSPQVFVWGLCADRA